MGLTMDVMNVGNIVSAKKSVCFVDCFFLLLKLRENTESEKLNRCSTVIF